MSGSANSILIEPANGSQLVRERLASEAITPGDLLEVTTGDQYALNNATTGAGATAGRKIFALENVARAGGIDDAYGSGETCRAVYGQTGDLVNARVAAGAAAIVVGVPLESAGDGTLKVVGTGAIVAYASEAVDNSGGGSAVRIQVEVA